MKRQVLGVLASMLAATALIAAQQSTAATSSQSTSAQKASADITVTGCLTQGSSSTVYLLDNAKQRPEDKTEKAVSYVVVPGSEDLALSSNLNHEVSVTGTPETAAMSSTSSSSSSASSTATVSAQKPSETNMPKFSAKSLTLVSDRCTAQVH